MVLASRARQDVFSDPFAQNAAQRQDVSCEKKPVRQNGLAKRIKQARLPVPVAYNLAEEGGFRIALRALHLVG